MSPNRWLLTSRWTERVYAEELLEQMPNWICSGRLEGKLQCLTVEICAVSACGNHQRSSGFVDVHADPFCLQNIEMV